MAKTTDVTKLNDKQKVNYVKNILFNKEINEAVDILLKDEKKDLAISNIIINVLKEDLIINRIKSQCNLTDKNSSILFVYSKMLGIFAFYNKTVILNNFLKSFSKEELKDIAIYEYQNKTSVSLNNKTFDKYCSKYKKEALDNSMIDEEQINVLDAEKKKYKAMSSSKTSKIIVILGIILLMLIIALLGYKYNEYNKLIKKYDGLIYPGIYLSYTDLSGKSVSEIKSVVIKEEEKLLNGNIIVKNVNGEYKYPYQDLGIDIVSNNLANEIKEYNSSLSFFNKIKYINSNKTNKVFNIEVSVDDSKIDGFITKLKEDMNTDPKDDGLVIDNEYNVSYSKGSNGFTLNEDATKKVLLKALNDISDEITIEAKGDIVKNEAKYESLSSVNTKVSSYTTYFVNAGNRGHNINLAASRLNGTIIMPGETFSYLKVAGPYGASNGYLPAPVYLNSEVKTENGGGVCQLASTLYNATLRAGLETVSRRGHTFAPAYVPRGLDATVYSTTTDFKVKNNYEYPMYIVSYPKGNYLTVDIWTNESALGGLTYEPYSVASNGGYLAYLKTIKDGQVIDTKYLDRSVYKVHP